MPDPDWLETAKKKGLAISGHGVNMDAFNPGAQTGTGHSVSSRLVIESFFANCESARNEWQFQDAVVELAHHFTWKVVHIRRVLVKMGEKTHYETPFDIDGAGSFDLDFYRERHFKAELKFGRNKPQENQTAWKLRYDQAGIENHLWYPADAPAIVEVLRCYRPTSR